jgi:murein L,D-transpeptidase YcbB/YkuD
MNISLRIMADRRGGWLFRPARHGFAAALIGAAAFVSLAPPAASAVQAGAAQTDPALLPGQGLADFYAARGGQPLWLRPGNEQAAAALVAQIAAARVDGLDPRTYRVRDLARALRPGGSPDAVRRADMALSQAYVAFARDLRRAPPIGVIYVDRELRPQPPSPRALLEAAASAQSLPRFVEQMGWMHPYYAPLRRNLLAGAADPRQRQLLAFNLERARSLPAGDGRYVLVNAAAQRLYMVEGGEVRDTMRVVVGKPAQPTPLMAAQIRYASLNPYWNVPPDLVAERIAPNVIKSGLPYLRAKGYQLLSDWGDKPKVLNPASADWKAIAAGRKEVRVRQLPGPANSMGDMKFMFPNEQGIYLHDTPNGELLKEAARFFSAGCVRLEDAPRLGRWLFGQPLRPKGARPEQKVALAQPVPVYLTYLTAVPSGSSIAWFEDIYGRDAARLGQTSRRGRR